MTNSTAMQCPAAYGGNPATQLRHLRAHRTFQRQERYKTARLDWTTTINREESRQHTTRHLQAKINVKDPRQKSRGKMDTPEAQDSMKRLARMIRGRHRLSPGDGHILSWNLRHRMVQSSQSCLSDESDPTKEQCFPPEIRAVLDELEELRKLLSRQGASPKRHRQAAIIQIYACSQCHKLFHQDFVQDFVENFVEKGQPYLTCPVCRQSLRETNLVRVAVKNDGSREPMGSMDCHRR